MKGTVFPSSINCTAARTPSSGNPSCFAICLKSMTVVEPIRSAGFHTVKEMESYSKLAFDVASQSIHCNLNNNQQGLTFLLF
jgi:hypothetical protein